MGSWYYERDGEIHGPFSDTEILMLARTGTLVPAAPVTNDELDFWYPAHDISGFEFGSLAPEAVLEPAVRTPLHSRQRAETADVRTVAEGLVPEPTQQLTPKKTAKIVIPEIRLPPLPVIELAPSLIAQLGHGEAGLSEPSPETQLAEPERAETVTSAETAAVPESGAAPEEQPDGSSGVRRPKIEYGGIDETRYAPTERWWMGLVRTPMPPLAAVLVVAATLALLPVLLTRGCERRRHAPAAETITRTRRAQAAGAILGEYLAQQLPGRRALVVTAAGTSDKNTRKLTAAWLRGLRLGFGDRVQLKAKDSPEFPPALDAAIAGADGAKRNPSDWAPPLQYWYTADVLDSLIDSHPECTLVITLVGLPPDFHRMRAWERTDAGKLHIVVATGWTPTLADLMRAGRVMAAVCHKPGRLSELPARIQGRELAGVFSRYYRLVTPANLDVIARRYPQMFQTAPR